MKKIILAFAATFAALNGYGVGATQEWVRRHVVNALSSVVRQSSATNIEVTASVPASAFVDGDAESTYTCTITAGAGTHAALKVVQSSVPEIPAGTFYALDGEGNYVNCSNALVGTIYAVPYTVAQVATNALGGVSTNYVKMGNFWAVDSTNGVWRMGIDGDTILYNSGNRAAHFSIRSTMLPERAAAVLIPPTTARLSIREMLSLVFPTACARTTGETVYTINREMTIAITTVTFTRTNRFGKTTEITFSPQGLAGVYDGPNGPFSTKEEAEAMVRDLSNWNFGDWDSIWNVEGFGRMTRAEFESSDVWRQLSVAVGTDRKEVEVPTPHMPSHPCPAPDDFYVFDATAWNNPNLTDEEAAAAAWKINPKYSDGEGGYNREALEQWRGENECKCAVVGCGRYGESNHRAGRVKIHNGEEVYSDDVDGGDGCKCCIRCVKYGSDIFATINEYNDHRASGEGAGFCGCACGRYTEENENEWDKDYHNLPEHTLAYPQLDFSCMCYCSKPKALNGEFVRHAKYAGDSPWCENICARCGMVEDQEQYISHNYPAFDTRHVTLRESKWEDHDPRAEAGPGVSALNDSTYYIRCGCACGKYDTAGGNVLPSEYGKFHQPRTSGSTCLCFCGQVHSKNSMGEGNEPATPWPCPEICAVCKKVEDGESTATITIDGTPFKKLVLIDPDDESYHTPDAAECGCKCYNGTYGGYPSRRTWSVGLLGISGIGYDGTTPKWHKRAEGGCVCKCGALSHEAVDANALLWRMTHEAWAAQSACPQICDVCKRKKVLGEVALMTDHVPAAEACGCACGGITSADSGESDEITRQFHALKNQELSCLCLCGRFHDGEIETKTCGIYTWKKCSVNPNHVEGTEQHEIPGGEYDETGHKCVCGEKTEPHGELVEGVEHVSILNADGKETGWSVQRSCPQNCGYIQTYVHTHHFTNCGTCDAGDDCTTVCTGCGGEHVFGEKTDKKCAHCECTMCEGCEATPENDITKHSGWEPCGEDAEDDNDWMEAKGGHCRCECRKYGHLARTEHDYQLTAGEALYEQCTDEDKETRHYVRLGTCTRCGQHKKQKQAHNFPDEPTSYRYKNDEICKAVYMCQCDGCDYEKLVEGSHSPESSPEVYENVSASICRWKYRCRNCKGLIKDDTHGHERDPANECKCKKGCGYQFAHDYVEDACGNESCRYCKAGKNGVVENHSGWADAGDQHKCACGRQSEDHTLGSWTQTGTEPDFIHYERSCFCGHVETKTEPCSHSFSDWTLVAEVIGGAIFSRTCSICNKIETTKMDFADANNCQTNINFHVPSESDCGCKCGKYGASGEASKNEEFHKWDDTDIARGVPNCRCKCGAMHKFREPDTYWKNTHPYEYCPGVCQSCRQLKSSGALATEDDHTPKHTSAHLCGCRCGYYGVDPSNGQGEREARTAWLHIQSHGTGTGNSPAWCQCWGSGTGGSWHWHHPFSDSSCSEVCQDLRPGDYALGHLAAGNPSPNNRGFTKATPGWHAPKTYGCGCKCGRCDSTTRNIWKGETKLHRPAQNAADQCHCSCESKLLVGSGIGGHEFAGTACTCTCGETYRSDLNACGVCQGGNGSASCGKIHKGKQRWYNTAGNHDYGDDTLCTCRCGTHTRSHVWPNDWTATDETTTYVCGLCDRTITRRKYEKRCTRSACFLTTPLDTEWRDETEHGEHPADDPEPYIPEDEHTCTEELKGGGTCGTMYMGDVCPNQENHKNYHSGDNGGGTDDNGNLDDILNDMTNPLWPIIGPIPGEEN